MGILPSSILNEVRLKLTIESKLLFDHARFYRAKSQTLPKNVAMYGMAKNPTSMATAG